MGNLVFQDPWVLQDLRGLTVSRDETENQEMLGWLEKSVLLDHLGLVAYPEPRVQLVSRVRKENEVTRAEMVMRVLGVTLVHLGQWAVQVLVEILVQWVHQVHQVRLGLPEQMVHQDLRDHLVLLECRDNRVSPGQSGNAGPREKLVFLELLESRVDQVTMDHLVPTANKACKVLLEKMVNKVLLAT